MELLYSLVGRKDLCNIKIWQTRGLTDRLFFLFAVFSRKRQNVQVLHSMHFPTLYLNIYYSNHNPSKVCALCSKDRFHYLYFSDMGL